MDHNTHNVEIIDGPGPQKVVRYPLAVTLDEQLAYLTKGCVDVSAPEN